MLFSIGLLIVIVFMVYRVAPRERAEDAHVHGAGQIGLLAAIALFGVDYFTSFYYATGEMMSALHPYGLQKWGFIAVAVIALTNAIFGLLYMYSLGVFNEGGGSYTASMRYLSAGISLIVAVVLIQDYLFTIVVSTLSGVDQALSLRNATGIPWIWHFIIAAVLVTINWFITIRGRGESGKVVFTLLGTFLLMTIVMSVGLFIAHFGGVPAVPVSQAPQPVTIGQALYHFLTASMKGLVALTGLEAMSNGIQFVKNEDAGIIAWAKKRLPRWKKLWEFYSGKSGIGRIVQTSFLFYGGITTLLLSAFSIRFDVFDGTLGRTLVGNLAFIGFSQIPGGEILFWAYQILAVMMLTAASMTAFQDLQATEWRDVSIGEIPEIIVYRDPQGHLYPLCDHQLHTNGYHHVCGQREQFSRNPFLWCWRVYAHHGHGFRNPEAYIAEFHWANQKMGSIRSRLCWCAVRDCVHRADRRQMDRRWLGGANLVQCIDPGSQRLVDITDRGPYAQANPSHRAREGTRARGHGFDSRVAVFENAGISLSCACEYYPLLRPARRESTSAV